SSRRRHTRWPRDWSSDVCSSDLFLQAVGPRLAGEVGEDHFEIAAELPEDLTARAARRRWRGGVRDDGDPREGAVSLGDRLEDRRSEERRVGNECRSEGPAKA